MKTRAAVLREVNEPWSVEEIELDDPERGEILVKTLAAGMCHSDEHAHDGTMPVPLPIVGGHEGAERTGRNADFCRHGLWASAARQRALVAPA